LPILALRRRGSGRALGRAGDASVPKDRNFSFISGSAIALPISAFNRSTISRGVPAGASTACQVDTSKPGNALSASVGNSGAIADRRAVVTANARSLPAFTCVITSEMLANITCDCPPSRSVTAGGPPL
jgi:hypothetical protein